MDRAEMFDRLVALLPGEFEVIRAKLGVLPGVLSSSQSSLNRTWGISSPFPPLRVAPFLHHHYITSTTLAWSSTGYYDLEDLGQVKVIRFDPEIPATVPVASRGVAGPWDVETSLEGEHIEARTVSNIAAWYNAEHSAFFIALRSAEPMRVFKSRDGIRWELDTSFVPTYSALGPSAASHWTGSNMLLHGR